MIIVENHFFLPKEEEVNFQSYFAVDNLLMTRVNDNSNEQLQVKYWELFDYMKQHSMIQKNACFRAVSKDKP
ncbi:hypothetical protein [Psychrobacillus antarcticus]|uniref:hypothetical protein n=1 Tax=Psychrobacillus antarcticus TaxID=2879115 RepID=UPI0024081C24|nr:hypothetical protein [Psychrobacillus antarcticus]